MNKIKKIFILTLIFTLPLNIFAIMWLNNTWTTYHLLDKFELTFAKQNRFYKIGNTEFDDLYNRLLSQLGLSYKQGPQLLIKDSSVKQLNHNLPLSGTESQSDSYLQIDGKTLKGKARYRGDHVYHWGLPDKSWRFKTSKKHVYKGINKFNFIILKTKDLLSNHISYRLAENLGLLAPYSELVDFTINGVYQGPRLMVEQIDESFLRKNRRMPNDIYKGDNIGQKKYFGVDVALFNNASIWDKASYNNHYEPNHHKPLSDVLAGLKDHQHDLLNLKGFAAFSALIDLTSTYHYDQTHNWILYYDHYYEKMIPIVWDTTGWSGESAKKENFNIITSDLLQSLYKNYSFIKQKHKVLYDFYTQNESNFLEKMDQGIQKSKNIIELNGFTKGNDRNKVLGKEALNYVDEFKTVVIDKLNKNKHYFIGKVKATDYKYSILNDQSIRLSINGSKLINTIRIELSESQKDFNTMISYHQNGSIYQFNLSEKVSYKGHLVHIPVEILANSMQVSSYLGSRIDFREATYDIHFKGLDTKTIKNLSFEFLNHSNQSIEVPRVSEIEPISFDRSLKNIITISEFKTLTWSGEKRFSGFNLVEENIVIEPGTKLLFEEGATLKVLGKVTAIGTAEQPIVLDALDSSKPWGAFALKDERANDSVFKHVIFKNGSGDKGELYEYTAMFSVHNVKGLLLEKSEFYDSKLTDDMVHIIYSDVKLKDSKFVRSLSDAVDIDISTAIVENCEFINSGNDSIDLMTSDAIVINTVFKDSKDKAISIGEGSNLLAINNLIENSVIGMQSKDTSLAYIYNTSFIGNDKAIDAYHKNWRYSEGGTIYVDKCVMDENTENATVGKKSKVVINDCLIDTMDNFDKKDIRKGKIIVGDQDYIPATFEQEFFQNHSQLIQKQTQGSYQ